MSFHFFGVGVFYPHSALYAVPFVQLDWIPEGCPRQTNLAGQFQTGVTKIIAPISLSAANFLRLTLKMI